MADGLPTTEALVAMPGPWEVVWLQGDKLGSPSEVCAAGTDNRVAFLASNGTLGTARLIAAAPDLLALLVEARNTRAADIVPGGANLAGAAQPVAMKPYDFPRAGHRDQRSGGFRIRHCWLLPTSPQRPTGQF